MVVFVDVCRPRYAVVVSFLVEEFPITTNFFVRFQDHGLGFAPGLGKVGGFRARLAAQENDVGRDGCHSRLFEGVFRQAKRTDQVGFLHQLGPNLRPAFLNLVHRALGRDERHDPAWANQFNRLHKEVVVQEAPLRVVLFVHRGDVSKRDVANHQIEVPLGQANILETGMFDSSFL